MESIPRHLWRTSIAAAHPVQHSGSGLGGIAVALGLAAIICYLLAARLRRRGK